MFIIKRSNWAVEFSTKRQLRDIANLLSTFEGGMIQGGHV